MIGSKAVDRVATSAVYSRPSQPLSLSDSSVAVYRAFIDAQSEHQKTETEGTLLPNRDPRTDHTCFCTVHPPPRLVSACIGTFNDTFLKHTGSTVQPCRQQCRSAGGIVGRHSGSAVDRAVQSPSEVSRGDSPHSPTLADDVAAPSPFASEHLAAVKPSSSARTALLGRTDAVFAKSAEPFGADRSSHRQPANVADIADLSAAVTSMRVAAQDITSALKGEKALRDGVEQALNASAVIVGAAATSINDVLRARGPLSMFMTIAVVICVLVVYLLTLGMMRVFPAPR